MRGAWRGLALVALLSGCVAPSSSTERGPARIYASKITSLRHGSAVTRYGELEFLSGLQMHSGNPLFGAASAIRLRPDDRHFIAVLDTGHWLTGLIERDSEGKLSGIADASIAPMIDYAGRTDEGKSAMDAEGLALRDGKVLVSYEQDHRVDVYPDAGLDASRPIGTIPILMDRSELKGNQSLEALMVGPPGSPLAGAAVLVTERSLGKDGNMIAAILDGPLKGRFTVHHDTGFDVSDGAFLPGGDLLLLQRRFDLAHGIGIRIVRIDGSTIKPGAVVDGRVIFEADADDQIDNMEGLDVFRAEDGSVHLIMISDDNHSILQRNLLLEFRMRE